MMQLTTGAGCRHPPKSLVDTAAAAPRRELQRRCGCVLPHGAGCLAWLLHRRRTRSCYMRTAIAPCCQVLTHVPCAVGHLQLLCLIL